MSSRAPSRSYARPEAARMMTSRRPGRLALTGWLLVVAALGIGLHQAGRGPLAPPPLGDPSTWSEWLAGRDPVVAAIAVLRLMTLAGLWYVAAMAAVGVVLRVVRADGLVAFADRLTVAPVRRLLVAAVGVSFASGLPPALAAGASIPRPPAVVYQLPGATTATPPPTLTMRVVPAGEAPATPAAPVSAPIATPPPAAAIPGAAAAAPATAVGTTWVVQPGECFWSIAEDVLTKAWGRAVTDAEIVPYWRGLIEANRARLGDRDNADLIFPAQVFTVPTPPGAP